MFRAENTIGLCTSRNLTDRRAKFPAIGETRLLREFKWREEETNSARSVHKKVAMASKNEEKKKKEEEKHVVHPREVRWMAEEK